MSISEHELLINQFEEEIEKLRKQIKQVSDAKKRFVQEVKFLKQQLSDKNKEIEFFRFKERNINGLIEQLPNQNQIAIVELKKVITFIRDCSFEPRYYDIVSFIEQQIKSL